MKCKCRTPNLLYCNHDESDTSNKPEQPHTASQPDAFAHLSRAGARPNHMKSMEKVFPYSSSKPETGNSRAFIFWLEIAECKDRSDGSFYRDYRL